MRFTRIFNDDQGKSHFGDLNIAVRDGGPIGFLSERFPVGEMIFRETPSDYDFKWHPAPQRQLLFIIKGSCEFMVSSGETRQFSGGDVLLLEDTQGEGHCSKALNNEIRHSIFVTVPEDVVF
ncbi:AraC family ligand binding domain-containing protein [Marinomonas transparens]|uniref:AraC-type arabinose-binding/dimerisation domain-containing protein n=1 Tax=Marinomonas transparens TaxID=2795388 RepID=A0A934JP65_9GAMM|nr:AraC family ligand binding domain-containing protein [Marinomonas transparens]MBJ7539401.1 hypothetical protein [Marinomonas transparens]